MLRTILSLWFRARPRRLPRAPARALIALLALERLSPREGGESLDATDQEAADGRFKSSRGHLISPEAHGGAGLLPRPPSPADAWRADELRLGNDGWH